MTDFSVGGRRNASAGLGYRCDFFGFSVRFGVALEKGLA